MAFPGFRSASTGILAALRASTKLRPSGASKELSLGIVSGLATPLETEIEPAVASMAHLQQILSTYLEAKDIATIREAYRFSDEAHLGQLRSSGSPYITHPISVAEICAGWKLDAQAIQAALLHDVIEDQAIAKQDLLERFGDDVAEMVDGLSKLDRLEFATKAQQQAESFRKMLLAMARDIRVILIKLADRLHNMRTLDAVAPDKRRRVAQETLDIYAPIAYRLGLNALYRELQDLCFEAIHPNRYRVLEKAVLAARGNRREVLSKIDEQVRAAMPAAGIESEVLSREKTLYGIYHKMVDQKKSFTNVLDIYGFRVIVRTLPECYMAMGIVHQLYRPVPGKFKDYIAIPKVNGYQSLHTTLVGPFGTPIEFQFRTHDMHQVAEEGVAAHWLYKADTASLQEIQSRTSQSLQSLLDIQSQNGDSSEFLEHVKVDLFPDAVYVFTPKGKIVSLPRGATSIDFAYMIHTDVGNHAVACKVNGDNVALRTELASGDTVSITTSPAARPSAQWLNYARTGRARSEIRHFLRTSEYDESAAFGERQLLQALKELNLTMPAPDDAIWDKLGRSSGAKSRAEILADIGLGKRLAAVVARRFAPDHPLIATTAAADEEMTAARTMPIQIRGHEGQAVQLAPCCGPLPGDVIVAGIRVGHGLVVHTSECPVAIRARMKEPERWVDVVWDEETAKHFSARIEIMATNERGILSRIAAEVAQADSNIINATMHEDAIDTVMLNLTVQVDSRKHLAQVFRSIRHVSQVQKIVRAKG
jgi:guanosine-3',5'-bis(diphosphate) 3'-pyrophosphohydrolase